MTATNHAITGALIGLAVSNPAIAVPLAFVSHFALDALPHYDPAGEEGERIGASRFRYQLLLDASICVLLVILLALSRPQHWFLAAVCAFVATSPDLFWLPKFIHAQRTGKTLPNRRWFWRLHHSIQWCTGPRLIWVEVVWFVAFGGLLLASL